MLEEIKAFNNEPDNSPEGVLIRHVYSIEAEDFSSAGEVSRKIKNLLKQLGVDSELVRRAAIACYEAELNLVIHSWGGKLTFQVTPNLIQIITEDEGPGIPDIDLAMKEGYSTASELARELGFGAGMGLPNIKRCADTVIIQSKAGQGTKLIINFNI
ncbi:MAG: anti-sigma regulatory factor [Clostridiales bacterium]|jgi:serine/threonine-protein kinase RsbT|nr:anti-sigma regulatory factor [Clostridiales bacterium]